jgi:hypothetical protein
MAVRSLSPKQIRERTQQHRQAVVVLARMRAKKAVERELQCQGLKPRYIAPREINQLAHDYLTQHRPELLAEAEHAIATWPGFKRWRLPCAGLNQRLPLFKC